MCFFKSPKIPKQYQAAQPPPPPLPPPALAPAMLDSLVPQFAGSTMATDSDAAKKKQQSSGRSSLVIPNPSSGVIQSGLQIQV